jgi:YbbR domain-containing protein
MLRQIISFITHDPMRKIFATIFAFGLWIYVAIGNSYSYQKEIKILYSNLPQTLVLVDSVSVIDVIFSGRGGALFSIWAAPPKAQCDLAGQDIGQIEIPTKDLRIPVGYGPLKVDFEERTIGLLIDRKIAKKVSIMIPVKADPKKGYAIDEIEVLDTIELTGPQKMLEQIDEIATESLNVRNRSISFEKDLKLEIQSPLIQATKKNVRAEVSIEQTMQKTLTDIPLTLIYAPEQRVKSQINTIDTLVVEGSPDRVRRLSPADITVRIKLTKLASGDYLLPAEIILPKYIKPVRSVPQKFPLTID